MRTQARWRWALVVAVVVIVTGCGNVPTREPLDGTGAQTAPDPSIASTANNTAIAFPQLAPSDGERAFPAALLGAKLELENGCLRAQATESTGGFLLIWPPQVRLDTSGDVPVVIDEQSGVSVQVGEIGHFGGGETGTGAQIMDELQAPIPASCPSPYWIVSGLVDAAGIDPQPAPTLEPTALPDEALVQDAQEVARIEGISVAEALRRLELQKPAGELGAALEANEQATFAGLWIQHDPEYRVVAAFTRDGAQTVEPYIAGGPLKDVIEIRRARWTLVELNAALEATTKALDQAKISTIVFTNVQENRIDVPVYDPVRVQAKLKAANVALPEAAQLVALESQAPRLDPDLTPTTLPTNLPVYFPQQRPPDGGYATMEALLIGTLINDNGCLRVIGDGGAATLVIWPHNVVLDATNDRVQVLDTAGEVVAREGERVRMGGGSVEPVPSQLREPFPTACTGPYWIAGEIDPLDQQHP